jgi:hypothetical protein
VAVYCQSIELELQAGSILTVGFTDVDISYFAAGKAEKNNVAIAGW